MRDGDIDSLSADGAQGSIEQTRELMNKLAEHRAAQGFDVSEWRVSEILAHLGELTDAMPKLSNDQLLMFGEIAERSVVLWQSSIRVIVEREMSAAHGR